MNPSSLLQSNGYCVLSEIFASSSLQLLKAQAISAISVAEQKGVLGPVNISGQLQEQWFTDSACRNAFIETLFSKELTTRVGRMLTELYVHDLQVFYNPTNAAEPYWHRDLQFSSLTEEEHRRLLPELNSYHLRVPLLPERGVVVVPGSHRRWDTHTERSARQQNQGAVPLVGEHIIELIPGDALIFHSELIHRGEYQANAARLAYDVCIGQAHPVLMSLFDPRNCVEPSLAPWCPWLEATHRLSLEESE